VTTGCIFCRIVAGEIPSEFIIEDDDVVAFKDVTPKAPTHVLVVPKRHIADWTEMAQTAPELAGPMVQGAARVAETLGLTSYRVVANTGEKAGQSVFHLHLHVMGGRPMLWPPG
jgi:histidine triad (HIT) family protein